MGTVANTAIAGVALAYAYIRAVEAFTRWEQRREQTQQAAPPTPLNALQRAVSEPEDAPRPVAPKAAQEPVKRGPGRPRKAQRPDLEQRMVGGKRITRTYAMPDRKLPKHVN